MITPTIHRQSKLNCGRGYDSTQVFCLGIESMTAADLPEVLAIERQSFAAPWSQAIFQEEMEKAHAGLRVARLSAGAKGRQVLGYVCFWLVAAEIQITNLAAHSRYRRRGIGRRLMVHALQQGYKAGARLALLEVRSSNQAARALYQKLGFVAVQERPHYYPEYRESALVMELSLDPGWWQQWHLIN